MILGLLASAGLIAFQLGGCGSSSGGGISATQACADQAQATCARLDACFVNGTALEYGDFGTCANRQVAECTASLAANGTGRTPANYEACAQQLPSVSCTDVLDGNQAPACQAPPGTLAIGAPCIFSAQCGSAYCAQPRTAACGTCQSPPIAGASCADLVSCGNGLACALGKCVGYATSGAACGAAQPCGAGLSCVTPVKATMGTCQTSGSSVGAPCDPKRQTGPGCDAAQGLYCSPTTKQCATDAYVPSGVCDVDFDVLKVATLCTGGALCYKNACVAVAMDGQPCDTAMGPDCLRPARCVGMYVDGGTSGTCVAPGSMQCQ